jgi:membrane-associated phospholipid phosphatase
MGGHYLTDILAGYAVGIAWSALIYTLIEKFFQGRRKRNVREE